MIFDYYQALDRLTETVTHYATLAPTVSRWADSLYVRIAGGPGDVTLDEVYTLQRLRDDAGWLPGNLAANTVYKLKARLGQDVTGEAGY